MASAKLWGGRFKKKTDAQFEKFSASFCWDVRLLPYDLKIDAAHVKALKSCGVLKPAEAAKLLTAILRLQKAYESGTLKLESGHEDVHSAIAAGLGRLLGPLADKLHTGRSRNDLVSQSTRLYCLHHIRRIQSLIRQLQSRIVHQAREQQDTLLPGMTHLQNAQILSLAHIFLAYAEMLERAHFRFSGSLVLADVCVLGSGALAGTSFRLNQNKIARELGLSKIVSNSYDAAGDRDFLLDCLFSVCGLGLGLSRIAEDLMIAQTKGFGWIEIDESFCTGSSMMPQKKNADFLELARGAAGVFSGNLAGFVTVLKGLPTSYNRDLQWDKKHLFESVELCEVLLEIFAKVFGSMKIRRERASRFLEDEGLYATDLADYLVGKGVPFKSAHDQAGRIIRFAESEGLPVSKIGLDLLRQLAPEAEADLYELFDPAHSVAMKKTAGSTHPEEIRHRIGFWQHKLKQR